MKQFSIFSLLLFIPFLALCQPGPGNGNLESDEIQVFNDFNATLAEATRVEILPSLPKIVEGDKNLVYQIPSKKITLEYLPPKLRPLGAKKQEPDPGYNGYAKLGYGFPNSPYGELGYEYVNAEKFRVGGELKHHSANNKKIENQKFSNTSGALNGAYFLYNDHTVEGNLGYSNDQVFFYGYDPEVSSFTADQVRQSFNNFNFGAKFFNSSENRSAINYQAGLDFYTLSDNYATTETGVDLKATGTKWFGEKHPLNVTLRTDFSSFRDNGKQSLNNFFLQPNFTYHAKKFKIKAGVNLASSDDQFFFFPDAEASVNIIGNTISVFAGASGDLSKNNLRSLSQYNPFISTFERLEVRNSSTRNYYGGVRGNLKTINYQAQIGLNQVGDLALFITDPMDSLRFMTIYDSAQIFQIKGTIEAKIGENLDVTLTAAQNIYETSTEEEAFGLPNFEATLGLRYKMMGDKLHLNANIFSQSGNWIKDEDTITDRLAGVFDISLGGEYYFMKNLGVFARVNNILGDQRQRWFRYPTYGINVLGGITARF